MMEKGKWNFLIYSCLSFGFLYLARHFHQAAPYLVGVTLLYLIPRIVSGFGKDKNIRIFQVLALTYLLWILVSFLMHYFALRLLPSLSMITVESHDITWGLNTTIETTWIYIFFPLSLLATIYLFQKSEKVYKWLIFPLFVSIPSFVTAVYQATVNLSFLNTNPIHVTGLNTDASAFGMSLFLLLPLSLLGILISRRLIGKIFFGLISVTLLGLLLRRGQLTTFFGLIAFGFIFPLVWIWTKKARSYFKPFMICSLLMAIFLTIFSYQIIHGSSGNNLLLIPSLRELVAGFRNGGMDGFIKSANHERYLYASQGLRMTLLSPLAGWGPGGYLRNLNDIRYQNGEKPILIHNAANQYLQMSSELGILGAILNFLFHIIPLWMVFRIRNRIEDPRERLAVTICFVTVVVWMFLYLTGPHIMLVDVLWLLNIYLAFLFTTALKHGYSFENIKWKPYIFALALFTAFFGFGTYETSFGGKGYAAKIGSDWWPHPEYGYYSWENWGERRVRWTTKESYLRATVTGSMMGFDVYAAPYNIGPEGLSFKVFINGRLWDEIHFITSETRNLRYLIPYKKNERIEIKTAVSKTFNPFQLGLSADGRTLGVAMSEIKFYDESP